MKVKKTLKSILASSLLAGSSITALAGSWFAERPILEESPWKVGFEPSAGVYRYNFSAPANSKNFTITGDTGLWDIPRVTTYNVTLPDSTVQSEDLSLALFVAYETKDFWRNFKIGKEFNFTLPKDEALVRLGVDRDPEMQVLLDLKTQNIFFFEKEIFATERMEHHRGDFMWDLEGGYVSLIGKLNQHDWSMKAETFQTPYGGRLVRTATKDLGSGKDYSGFIGLKAGGFGPRAATFIEAGLGFPLGGEGVIKPSWGARAGFNFKY